MAYSIYVPKCPPDCGMFDCANCWKAGVAMAEGVDVVRYTPAATYERYGQRTMDLPEPRREPPAFHVINGGRSRPPKKPRGKGTPPKVVTADELHARECAREWVSEAWLLKVLRDFTNPTIKDTKRVIAAYLDATHFVSNSRVLNRAMGVRIAEMFNSYLNARNN